MEYEFYEDVVDAYEAGIGVEPGDSLTDYIRKNNIKIKEIEPFRTDAKEGGLMVAIQKFANGGGVGSMMQPKKKVPQLVTPSKDGSRPGYRGPGEYQGGRGYGGSKSSSSDKGTGGSKGNLGGGGGGQNTTYRSYQAPTKKTYTSKTIDSKPVTSKDYRDSRNDFVNTLNRNNQITAERNNTRFIPYQGGARTSSYYNPNPLSNLFKLAAGIAIPGASFFLNKGSKLKDGIMNINDSIQNSDFGRSTSLMDYLDMKKFGGYDEREMARQINKDEAKNLQTRIDGGEFGGFERPTQTFTFDNSKMKPPANITGLNNNDYEGEIGAVNNNDFVGLNTNAIDMQNYMTDQASFTPPGITPTNLNDFEGIRSTPQLNNNDYQLGTPQLNNNDFIGLNTNRGIPFTNAAAIRAMTQPVEAFKNTGPFTAAGNTSPPSSPFTDQSYGIQDPYQQNYLLDQGRSITTDMYQSPNEGEVTASLPGNNIVAGNYSQNAVSNQLYGVPYDDLPVFDQQKLDSLIEQVGTKSTGELARNGGIMGYGRG
tara:strand:- start:1261 stop:2871 length:1611 start_codon:yes stop_codon:yes gene_type:complete